MALAHCAVELARKKRKVLIVDFDLEAPGQQCTSLFHTQFTGGQGPQRGFLDFVTAYEKAAAQGLPDLRSFIELSASTRDHFNKPLPGEVYLLAAGALAKLATYRAQFEGFSWNEALTKSGGFGLLRHLRSEVERLGFDDVLLDARTGDSDAFYVVATELADVLVMVSGYNRQNILGTEDLWKLLHQYPKNRQPQRIILVGSPKPDDGPYGDWLSSIRPLAKELPDFEFDLPYQSRLVYAEEMLGLQNDSDKNAYVAEIRKLVSAFDKPPKVTHTEPIRLGNPFSVLRTDYAESRELLRVYVDPGQAITRALAEFMPLMIYGNRGTGKTMLAKHHDWQTALAGLNQAPSPNDLPQVVGLYLRFDIDLLNSFNTRDEKLRKTYNQLFANFLDILVVRKALLALDAFGGIAAWCDELALYRQFLSEFGTADDAPVPANFREFQTYLEGHFSKIRRYLNNPEEVKPPFRLQGNILMKLLVEGLLAAPNAPFGERYFAVMVDEVEHFEEYQQRVLNSRIKQIKQSDRVTYRYLLRHEGLRTRATIASEVQIIQETHDFRTMSLDEGLPDDIFKHHAISVANRQLNLAAYIGSFRLADSKRDLTQLFASITPEEEAQRLLSISKRQGDPLQEALLKLHPKLSPQFLAWMEKESSILRRVVAVIMLNQGKPAEQVVASFEQWNEQAKNWYHNYHQAALFWLLSLYGRDKLYAGLAQILLLSGKNLRYFLEYCRAIVEEWIVTGHGDSAALTLPISVEIQDRAIRSRAQFYIDDLRGKPRYAEQMLNLVKRLGNVFQEAHRSPRQSQFEINHFTIADYDTAQVKDLDDWLRECRMENVLLRRLGNKQKDLRDDRLDDWTLHPCFAPYFQISPRRKKKLEDLTSVDLAMLFDGDREEFKKLFARYEKKFSQAQTAELEQEGSMPGLFDDETD